MVRIFNLLLLLTFTFTAYSQITVEGTILDEKTSDPLIGANVVLKGSAKGTVTDINGKYTLQCNEDDILQISYIGYSTLEITAAEAQSNPNIILSEGLALDEVVVTALGIKRSEKALGYASQNVDSKTLDAVRSSNPFTALKGKVAGLQVNTSSNGLASSSRIVIRGENSLNINENSPLIVVDGTIINNDIYGVGSNSTDQANLPTDYGNAALDINPGDIESINVLKGAAAAALYGQRGGNGVIIITTKTGEGTDKLGINFSSNTSWSSPLRLPETQKQYGGGWGEQYYADFGTNFGPRLGEGLMIPQDGHPGFADGEAAPFIHRYNLDEFFETGFSTNNQISLAGAHDRGHFRLSFSDGRSQGIVPNTNLNRNNVSVKSGFEITDKWKVNLSGSYINSQSKNLPVAGYGDPAIMYNLIWGYNNVDLDWLRDYWVEEDVQQFNIFSWGDNPFFLLHENLNGFNKDRIFGNINTTLEITPELSLMLRAGRDNFDDFRQSRRAFSSVRSPNGMYREQSIAFTEDNFDFLLTYNKRFTNFSTVISAGGNRMNQRIAESLIQGNGLSIPGIYNLNNINVTPILDRFESQKRINSVYAFANIGYKDFLYLDLTARNDWSSTLPSENNSYFYPSASLSFILDEVINFPAAVDYLKLRANIAQVGLDTDPYRLERTYQFGTLPNSATNPSLLPNSGLKPVRNTSTELGLQGAFFGSRLNLDLSVFRTISTDQIIQAAISEAAGFDAIVVNAGEIESKGLELSLNGSPIRTNSFDWNIGMNFNTFNSVVNELYEDLETFIIAEGPGGATVEARPGGRLGDIYGNVFDKSPDGEVIYTSNGLPAIAPNRQRIGNYNPDWLMGVNTSLNFKGFTVYALFNIRQGGYIYSYTNAIGAESGLLTHSLEGHEDGIVGEGVVRNADGTFSPNTTTVAAEAWYYGGYYNRSNVESNGFDASFVKLKEASIGYNFPQSLTDKLGLSSLSLALTGNNLALWTDVPHIDPEAQALNGGTLVPGFEVVQLPSVRSFGFKLNVGL